jgi:cytochrome c5
MKKITLISMVIIAMYSCAKKMTPVTTTPSPNTATGKVTAAPAANSESKTNETKAEASVAPAASETAIANDVAGISPMSEKKESAQVIAGKEVFKAKCGRCHELKAPENYSAAKWTKIVDWMAPKAKLETSEKENVLAYVSFYAKSGG